MKVYNFRFSTAQAKFHQICTLIGCFVENIYNFSEKSTEELCLMILKIDAKVLKKMICCFKNDKNSVNFDSNTQKLKTLDFYWFLC